jgi:hypothetical protein
MEIVIPESDLVWGEETEIKNVLLIRSSNAPAICPALILVSVITDVKVALLLP